MMPCYIYIHFDPHTQTTRTSANDIKTTENPTKSSRRRKQTLLSIFTLYGNVFEITKNHFTMVLRILGNIPRQMTRNNKNTTDILFNNFFR